MQQSHDNLFPVVNSQNHILGVIRYSDIQDTLFDPSIGSLVCAADLAVQRYPSVEQDRPLEEAWTHFRRGGDDCLIVVDSSDPPHFVGLIRRRDLLRFFAAAGADAIATK
jgi:predicted transcriptional regulator